MKFESISIHPLLIQRTKDGQIMVIHAQGATTTFSEDRLVQWALVQLRKELTVKTEVGK